MAQVNRAKVVQLIAAHEAAAAALRARLEGEARDELDHQGVAPTWNLPGARVSVSTTDDRVVITDDQVFMAWFIQAYPDEVVRREVVEVRNPTWFKRLLGQLAKDPEAVKVIPGLRFQKGGVYKATSVIIDRELKGALAERARGYAAGTRELTSLLDVDDKPAVS
jgi:hypothetical protein